MTYYVPGDDSTCAVSDGQIVIRPGDRVLIDSTAPTWVRTPSDGRFGHRGDVYCAEGSQVCEVQDFSGATLATLNGGEHATVVYQGRLQRWTPYTGGGAAVAVPPVTTTIATLANVAATPGTDGSYLVVNDPANPPTRYYERIAGVWVEQGGAGTPAQVVPTPAANLAAMNALAPQPVGTQVRVADDGNGLPRTFVSDGTGFVPLDTQSFNVPTLAARDALTAYPGDFAEVADDGTGAAATFERDADSWNLEAPITSSAVTVERRLTVQQFIAAGTALNFAAPGPQATVGPQNDAVNFGASQAAFDASTYRIEVNGTHWPNATWVYVNATTLQTPARFNLTDDIYVSA